MGRHTADHSSDRDPREHLGLQASGERRAALNRTRNADASVLRADPPVLPAVTAPVATPKSVAANRVSDENVSAFAHETPRVVATAPVRQRPAARSTAGARPTATASVNTFARKRARVPAISFFGVFLFVGGSLFNPLQADVAQAAVGTPVLVRVQASPQEYTVQGSYASTGPTRDGFGVTMPKPKPKPKPKFEQQVADDSSAAVEEVTATNTLAAEVATPDPGTAQAVALDLLAERGWGTDQFNCLVPLWNGESGWNVAAANTSSGAYGIPQALPGVKMASVGADWRTNPATQITWGLNYIAERYGTPCGAWGTWQSRSPHWY